MDTHLIEILSGLMIQENGTKLKDDEVEHIADNFITEEIQILFESVDESFSKYKHEFNQLEQYMKLRRDTKVHSEWMSALQNEYKKQSQGKEIYDKMSWMFNVSGQLLKGQYDFSLTHYHLTDDENDNLVFILLLSNNQPLLEKMLKCKILHSTIKSIQVAEYLKSPLVAVLRKELEVV